jgi:hypothetical protein
MTEGFAVMGAGWGEQTKADAPPHSPGGGETKAPCTATLTKAPLGNMQISQGGETSRSSLDLTLKSIKARRYKKD